MEKLIMSRSQLKECYSGPIVWSNCRETGPRKFPMVSQLQIKFELNTSYNFDTIQVNGLSLFDCPGQNPCQNCSNVPPGCSANYGNFYGKWDFQKDSMYTSRPNAISEGFSKNQIKIINRMIEEKIRNYMENQNYDYYGN